MAELVAVERIIAEGGLIEPGEKFECDEASVKGHLKNGTAAKPGSKDAKAAKSSDDDSSSS